MKDGNEVNILKISDVLPNRFQPRIKFNEEKINELSDSIKKYGVIQPIIVRRVANKYEIIAGERRYKASIMAGLTEIPVLINNLSDEDSSEVALIENVQRENLTPTEEAISYKRILDMGYMTQESLAKKLGVSQSAVANKLRLLNLTEEVQEALLENKISERHARSLLRLKSHLDQEDMLKELIKNRYTVRQLDKRIDEVIGGSKNLTIPSIFNEEKKEVKTELKQEKKEEKMTVVEQVKEAKKEPNDDIEILDIINNINKEEKIMNNDNINMFQVPNVPIENDTPVVPVTNQAVGTNPGFMDIDKIEKEATDINVVNTNIAPTVSPVTNTNPIPVQNGKFFDMNQTQNINSIPGSEVSVQSVVQETVQAPVQNVFEMPVIEPVAPVVTESVQASTPSSFEMPTVEPVKPVVDPVMPVEQESVQTPTPGPFEMPIVEPVQSVVEPVQTPLPSPFEMPVVEPIVPVQPIIPVEPVQPAVTVAPTSPVQINETVASEPVTVPVSPTSAPLSSNVRAAINEIREISEKFEAQGTKIEMDEMDLPYSYVVTLKIGK